MTFLLVDQLSLYPEMDAYLPPPAPNLGIACLVGACRVAGIDPLYYDLTGRFLEIAFRQSADEISRMARDRRQAVPAPGLPGLFDQESGSGELTGFLDACYDFCTHPSAENYTDSDRVFALSLALKTVLALYYDHLKRTAGESGLVRALCREIADTCADVIGFSVHTMDNPIVNAVIRRCAQNPDVRVLAGGPLTMRSSPEALDAFFFRTLGVEAYVRGYAEAALPELLHRIPEAGALCSVPNVRCRVDGRTRSGPDADSFATGITPRPDFSLFDLDRYFFPEPLLPLQTARGCYWKQCAFCRREVSLAGYQEFPIQETAEQVRDLSETWNTRCFCINNECLHPHHAQKLSRALLAMNPAPRVRLMAGCRPDKGFTAETLALMHEAGFRTIFWGIESGSDEHLGRIGKGTTVSANESLLRDAAHAGLANLCFFLIGFPGESEDQAGETIRFIKRNRMHIDFFRMNPFALFDDSAVFCDPASFGVKHIGKNPRENKYEYLVSRGLTAPQASAIVASVHEAWEKNPSGYTSARYATVASVGFGDEKIPFYFWQKCREG